MTGFKELGLSDAVLDAVEALGYAEPTSVQSDAIPVALEGRDIIASAQTGTGKTAAFSLPAFDRISRMEANTKPNAPRLLVVTPTRELAAQIEHVCSTISRFCAKRIMCVIGGVDIEPQIKRLSQGVDVLIGTPGRIIDLANQDALDLGSVAILVLDEADRMLDMGFLPQVREIVDRCPSQRQTMLFSATVERNIEKHLKQLLSNPEFVEASTMGETADTVRQFAISVDHRSKPDLLAALLRERGYHRVIVFARTRRRVDACVERLCQMGCSAAAIHADRSQAQRRQALQQFASGHVDVLVATDVLARGIDVSNVSYVVNYDVPVQAEDYVHRIGRTGRAGERGLAFTFVTPETRSDLAAIEKLIGEQIPRITISGFDSHESERAMAAKAARKAARTDPELAQAAKEYEARLKRKEKRVQAPKQNSQTGGRGTSKGGKQKRHSNGSGKAAANRKRFAGKTGTSSSSNGKKQSLHGPSAQIAGRKGASGKRANAQGKRGHR